MCVLIRRCLCHRHPNLQWVSRFSAAALGITLESETQDHLLSMSIYSEVETLARGERFENALLNVKCCSSLYYDDVEMLDPTCETELYPSSGGY